MCALQGNFASGTKIGFHISVNKRTIYEKDIIYFYVSAVWYGPAGRECSCH